MSGINLDANYGVINNRNGIIILDIIHCPVFFLKHSFSESGFCLRL
jgi:hypothetical protein